MTSNINNDIQYLPIMSVDEQDDSGTTSIWLEIALLMLAVLGVYFIISDIDLNSVFKHTFFSLDNKVSRTELSSITLIGTVTEQFKLSTIIGVSILCWTMVLGILRFRHRLVTTFKLPDECPECGSILKRKDRTALQRIITSSLLLKSRSFYCDECDEKNLIFRYKVKTPT